MKITISFFLAIISCLTATAQFKLSGRILNHNEKDNLQINIPLVYGFHKRNSLTIPIAQDGSFSISLSIKQQKIATLIYKKSFHFLFLNPNKDLTVNINDTTLNLIDGSALTENKTFQKINFEEFPDFLEQNQFQQISKLTLNQIKKQIVAPYLLQRNKKVALIESSYLSNKDKSFLALEIKSIAYNYLNDLSRTINNNKPLADSLVLDIFENADLTADKPHLGNNYYSFIDNYLRYLEARAFIKIKEEKIASNQPIPYFGISLDSANVLMKTYSKDYWRLLGALKNLPPHVVEQYNFQQLNNLYYNKDLNHLEKLSHHHIKQFKNGEHNTTIINYIDDLKLQLAKNQNNPDIIFFEKYENVNSIYEVIKTLKGKVVYLDVWGTWCGPCKYELNYNPELKARFKDKDVAFVYLDMDSEDKDAEWKEFVKLNGLTGIHLRKNRETIAPFWKELLDKSDDKEEYYPQYFIFDKEGNLVLSKAKRPSDKEELYQQIEGFLK